MLRAYFRLVMFIAALAGAVILFAFAFTAAAVVVFVALALLALFGRPPNVAWHVMRRETFRPDQPAHDSAQRKAPLTIDHDPNDLPER